MNREIKFRMFSDNKMYYDIQKDGFFGEYIYKYHIMQFTGLQDKNGKDIYEGDIVLVPENYGGDLLYEKCIGVVKYEYTEYYVDKPKGYYQDINWSELEVIGNIYETPELLTNV